MNTFYRITEVAQHTGLSAHTLRYYERIGLIDAVARKGGHRLYNERDMHWLMFLLRLRSTGMSIAHMLSYAELRRAGETLNSISKRRQLLEQHAHHLNEKIATLEEHLSILNEKITLYASIEAQFHTTEQDKS